MSDDVPHSQIVPMQTDSTEMHEHYKENEEFDAQFDEPNASTETVDEEVSADDGHAAALAILPQDDAAFAQQVLGIGGHHEVDPDQEEQREVPESVEDDLEPESQPPDHVDANMLEHADADLEPEQAQRNLHVSIDQDAAMEDMANRPDDTVPATDIVMSRPDQHNVDMDDSSSLFIPEHYSSSHSPAPVPPPPRLNAALPRQASIPARPAGSRLSVFAKVRDLQRRAQERNAAYRRFAAASRISEDVDPETYLDAVTAGIRPPPGAYPQPEVDQDEMAHRLALAEFQKQKKRYEDLRRQNGGRLGFRHDIEWMKIQGAEHARIKKRQRELVEMHEGDEQNLFPPVRNHADEDEEESDDTFYGENTSRKRRRGEQPRKQNKPVSFQDAELQAMRVALEADEDVPKKKKKGSAGDSDNQASQSTSRSRGSKSKTSRAPRAKAGGKSAAKGPRKTAKVKRDLERATKQATSLFNANVFEQQAGMGAADQPSFRTRNKAEALKELIASVPVAEKIQARNDMNTLLQASKDFDGRGACKIAPGNNGHWLVRGMRTSLKGYQVLGTAFMRRRENDVQEPRGGLMADQMGLGKTLMMLGKLLYPMVPVEVILLTKISEHCKLSRSNDPHQRSRPEDYTPSCKPCSA